HSLPPLGSPHALGQPPLSGKDGITHRARLFARPLGLPTPGRALATVPYKSTGPCRQPHRRPSLVANVDLLAAAMNGRRGGEEVGCSGPPHSVLRAHRELTRERCSLRLSF